jgi:hypothetical protein
MMPEWRKEHAMRNQSSSSAREKALAKLRAATEKKSKVSPIDVAAELLAQSRQRHPRRTTMRTAATPEVARGSAAADRVRDRRHREPVRHHVRRRRRIISIPITIPSATRAASAR